MNIIQQFFIGTEGSTTKYSHLNQSYILKPVCFVGTGNDPVKALKKALSKADLYKGALRESFSKFGKVVESQMYNSCQIKYAFYTINAKMKKPAIGVCIEGNRLRFPDIGHVVMLSGDMVVNNNSASCTSRNDYYYGEWKKMNTKANKDEGFQIDMSKQYKAPAIRGKVEQPKPFEGDELDFILSLNYVDSMRHLDGYIKTPEACKTNN